MSALARAAAPALALGAVAAWALVPQYPNYDAFYHLVWGRELLDGVTPTFEAYAAPTPHPLELLVAAVLGLTGVEAERLLVLVTMLCWVALVLGVWRLARLLFGSWPAALAALFVASSFAFLLYAVRAYVDMPFLALVVWAAVTEVKGRGARAAGLAPFALLLLAGLLRPEAWVLSGLLWLWRRSRAPARERVVTAVLVVAAPLIWAAVDLGVTGDPLHSLTGTSSLAEELGRERGLASAPGAFVRFLVDLARPPVVLAGAVGAWLAARRYGLRALAVPLGMLAAGVVTYLGVGVAGLSLLPRYLTVPAVALAVFAGYGVAGFTTLPAGHPWRGRWRTGAAVAVAGGLVFLAVKLPSFGTLATELRFQRAVHDDLETLLATPEVGRARRCGPLTFPNYRLVPDARWLLDLPHGAVRARSAVPRGRRPDRGVAVFVLGEKMLDRYGFADGASPSTNAPDPGFAPLVRTRRFAAYAACPGTAPTRR